MKTRINTILTAVCASAFLLPVAANAQDVVVAEEATSVTEFNCDNTDRYYSSWRDNWFIQVGAGVTQPIVERGLGHGNGRTVVDKHIMTAEYNFAVGRWFTPYIGFRLNAVGGVLHWDNPSSKRMADGWTRANHVNLSLEFMWDMCNSLGGVNPDRPFSVIPFVGLGGDFMWNMKGINGGAPAATNILNRDNDRWQRSWTLPVSAGVQFRLRLCDYVDFFAEARASFYGDNWNGCAYGQAVDAKVSCLGGFNFNIGGRGWDSYNESVSASEIAALNGEVNNLRAELLESNQALAAALAAPKTVTEVVNVEGPDQPLLATVRFKINSSVIESQEDVNVYNMAQYLKDNPSVNIVVAGYADKDTGTAEYNQALSQRRAQAVADALVKKYGISSDRISVQAEGSSTQPYPANNDWNRIVIFENK